MKAWQGIDHGVLSASGRVSRRSEKLAKARNYAILFPDGFPCPQPPPQPTQAEALYRQAAQLRELADRGMSPTKYRKKATKLEAEAARLTCAIPPTVV